MRLGPTASSNHSLSLGLGQYDFLGRWFVAVDDLVDHYLMLLWLWRGCGEGGQGLPDVVPFGYWNRHRSRNNDRSWGRCFLDDVGLDLLLGVTPHCLAAQNSLPYIRIILDSHAAKNDDGYEKSKKADTQSAADTNDGNQAIVEIRHD
jgi:hypothetical protein